MSPAFHATFWGFFSGEALIFGVAIGYFVKVPARTVAGLMALGSGVLISALSFELTDEAFEEAGPGAGASGFWFRATHDWAGLIAVTDYLVFYMLTKLCG